MFWAVTGVFSFLIKMSIHIYYNIKINIFYEKLNWQKKYSLTLFTLGRVQRIT